MRVRLDLAYDGARFHGWADQPGLRTVQGVCELWLGRLLDAPVALTVAGRTDAGVHAVGQVAHFDLPDGEADNPDEPEPATAPTGAPPEEPPRDKRTVPMSRGTLLGNPDQQDPATTPATAGARPDKPQRDNRTVPMSRFDPGDLLRRLNRVLPGDIAVNAVTLPHPDFDARFSAVWRRYVYRLCDGVPNPLTRGYVVDVGRGLDVAAMREAGVGLLGLHDFAAFCKAREGATTIRQLQTCQIERVGQVVELTLRADAFCHSMVRSLTGGLVEVGLGRRDPAWLVGLLDTPTRAGDVRVMPAKGLVLAEVGYPPDGQLAARNAAARSVRQLPKDGCC